MASSAQGRRDAPGVYVEGRKLASLGLRVRRGASYHGLALNVDMDPAPFARINPCGMAGLAVTSLARLGVSMGVETGGPGIRAALRAAAGLPRARRPRATNITLGSACRSALIARELFHPFHRASRRSAP